MSNDIVGTLLVSGFFSLFGFISKNIGKIIIFGAVSYFLSKLHEVSENIETIARNTDQICERYDVDYDTY